MSDKLPESDIQIVVEKCPHCGREYQLGYNGIVGSCDECAKIERDADGIFWEPGEAEMVLMDVRTGEKRTVLREDALKATA